MHIINKAKTDGIVFDGGMGTMLIQEGLTDGKASELWNLEKPDIVGRIHRAYFQSGSDVVTTNTFGATTCKLKMVHLENHMEEINRAAVRVAREAAGDDHLVAGDIGPLGEMLAPIGTMSISAATDFYTEQISYLSSEGVDFFIMETMFDIQESLAAIKAARSVSDLPIFSTLTFQKTPTGFSTLMGNPVTESMKTLLDAGAAAVGANCTLGSDDMTLLAKEIRRSVDAPVIIQPNAGEPTAKGDDVIYPEDLEYFSENILKAKQIGVEIVGGCCGTSPDYIRRICEKIR